ncbi:MAG: hypothetical protein EXS31_16435 [Pedosphaera sp.]|nr:hypothetical protein [Pedosphaera sp.]
MKLIYTFSTIALVALLGAGCDSTPKGSVASDGEANIVSLFKAGKGVRFCEETRMLFGLQVTEVIEKSIPHRVRKTAQVYRESRGANAAEALARLSAEEAGKLRAGQQVNVISANGGREISGTLVRLDSQTLATLGHVEALIEFADPEQHCPMGSFLTLIFTNRETKTALLVPESALLTSADGSYVFTVNETYLTRTCVKAGAAANGLVAIEDGLYAGDSVASEGINDLWLVELSALKGGTPCCPVPKKNADK